jgi:hypothetical protein
LPEDAVLIGVLLWSKMDNLTMGLIEFLFKNLIYQPWSCLTPSPWG